MRAAILGVAVAAAACLERSPATPPTRRAAAAPRSDSAAILHAAWQVATENRHPGRALWLWAPSAPDTVRAVPLSPAVRGALVGRGIPASERRPAGDDTVVFRVTRWQADSAGVLVELLSAWTTVLGAGARRCRKGSGNIEQFRVRRRGGEWRAEPAGPVAHGDNACAPLAPGAAAARRRPNIALQPTSGLGTAAAAPRLRLRSLAAERGR